MSLTNVFLTKLGDKLPEDTTKLAEQAEQALNGENNVVEQATAEVSMEYNTDEIKIDVAIPEDNINGEATLSQPDAEGFQEFVVPEGYQGEEVHEQLETVEENPVETTPEEAIQPVVENLTEETQTATADLNSATAEPSENVEVITNNEEVFEVEVKAGLEENIKKIVEDHTKNAVKEILELVKGII